MLNSLSAPRALMAGFLLLLAAPAWPQAYPSKTIHIVTVEPGGSADLEARPLAQNLSNALKTPVVVDNRPGRIAAGQAVLQSAPDGYTLMVNGNSLWVGALLDKTPYDPVKDFIAISELSRQASLVVIHPSLPVNSMKEFIAYAKARPGQLNYSHGSPGSASHLSGAMFKSLTGVDMVFIPHKGAAQALTDVVAGNAQMMMPNPASAIPLVRSGKLRAIAVTSAQPSASFPDFPPVAQAVPDFDFVADTVVFAPAKTPAAIISRLNAEAVRYANLPETRERLRNNGVDPVGSSTQEAGAMVKKSYDLWAKIIKETGIKADPE